MMMQKLPYYNQGARSSMLDLIRKMSQPTSNAAIRMAPRARLGSMSRADAALLNPVAPRPIAGPGMQQGRTEDLVYRRPDNRATQLEALRRALQGLGPRRPEAMTPIGYGG